MHSFGEELTAPANGLEIVYQEMGDPSGEPLVLVMGLATQMLAWDEGFCSLLADRGFRVIRFDNRDIGRSTRMDGAPVPTLAQIATRRIPNAPYKLADMALDTVGLLDALEIERAHVVGASMGGMIAQTVAARHPLRTRSLTSIMSNTGGRFTGSRRCAATPCCWASRPPSATRTSRTRPRCGGSSARPGSSATTSSCARCSS
jgi:pimeloyl-ACP methyl ester carboxylesterase